MVALHCADAVGAVDERMEGVKGNAIREDSPLQA